MVRSMPFTPPLHTSQAVREALESLRGGLVAALHQMRVRLERGRFVSMPQALRKRLEVDALGKAPRRMGVAKAVEGAFLRQPQSVSKAAESL